MARQNGCNRGAREKKSKNPISYLLPVSRIYQAEESESEGNKDIWNGPWTDIYMFGGDVWWYKSEAELEIEITRSKRFYFYIIFIFIYSTLYRKNLTSISSKNLFFLAEKKWNFWRR